MGEYASLLRTIESLYSAVLDERQWSMAMTNVARLVGGTTAFHLTSDPRGGRIVRSEAVGISEDIARMMVTHYAEKDPRVLPAVKFGIGVPMTDDQLVDPRTLRRSEVWSEIQRPYDIPHLIVMWLKKDPTAYVSLSIQASAAHGRFEESEVRRFAELAPHLVNVVHARDLLIKARATERFAVMMLDSLPYGVMLVDESGRVVEMNSAALGLVRRGEFVSCARRRVHALRAGDDAALQKLIASARWKLGALVGGGRVAVKSVTNGRPLCVMGLPLPDHATSTYPAVTLALMLVDPNRDLKLVESHLVSTFDLSKAEARLAARLFSGLTLSEAGRQLELSYNTCKTQLRQVFSKTGCSSQVELAKKLMLLSLAAASSHDHPYG